MTPELAPPLLTTTPHQREDVSALDRFNVHRCPTRRVLAAGEERKGLPLGLAVCSFGDYLNPSSSTIALLRVSLLTSDLGTLLALSEVLFSVGAAAFFRF
ncbi:hypothetical protein TNCV_1985581 [Trichonephila clavipes]|nr:hypothetical protein TNCV_1985581 [Trichonephila clavipes]